MNLSKISDNNSPEYKSCTLSFSILKNSSFLNITEKFIKSNIWDEIWQFKANKQLYTGVRAPYLGKSYSYMKRFLDDNLYVYHK